MKTPSVLIVDDEPDILLMLRTALGMEGFPTALAGDGETALARARETSPDVVLLDLMMPMMDGWALIQGFSDQKRRPGLIVVSAKTRAGDVAKAFRLGADAYVIKPFDFEVLIQTIRDVAARSEKERAEHRQEMLARLDAPPIDA